MSSPQVKEMNAKAMTAMKAANYTKAVEWFTEALKLEGEDGKYYAKILGNRSHAYYRDTQYRLASKDAETAIDLDPEFCMGHVRKADALWALKRHGEAIEAYDKALNCTEVTKESSIRDKRNKCKAEMEGLSASESKSGGANGSSGPSSSSSAAGAGSSSSSSSSSSSGWKPPPKLAYLELILHLIAIITGVMFLFVSQAYYWCLKAVVIVNAVLLYRKASRQPEFKSINWFSVSDIWGALKSWFPREFISSNQVLTFFPAAVLLINRPIVLGLAPLLGKSVMRLPALLGRHPSVAKLSQPLIQLIQSRRAMLLLFFAQLEVWAGFLLVIQTMTGSGSLMSMIMYWQYLRMSYMIARHPYAAQHKWAQNVTTVWANLATQVDGWVGALPAPIQSGYHKMKGFLNRMTDPEAQSRGGGSGLLGSCNIM